MKNKYTIVTPYPAGRLRNIENRISTLENSGPGGGLTVLTVTGTVNDTNTSFTTTKQPTLVGINGVLYRTTGDSITWTYSGGTLTLSQAVGTGGSIYALG